MINVSFYILPSESLQERYVFACKLIEKAYRTDCFCYVLTESVDQSRIIDNLLWTFRAGSFVPHQIYTGELPDFEKIVMIGTLNPPENWQKVVFNLSNQFLELGANTERILEILDNSESSKEAGRQRYRHYQKSGMAITTHKDW